MKGDYGAHCERLAGYGIHSGELRDYYGPNEIEQDSIDSGECSEGDIPQTERKDGASSEELERENPNRFEGNQESSD